MRKLIERIPLQTLIVITIFLAVAPFIPEPHLWQKIKMLAGGTLVQPIDILDLVFHAGPAVVLALRVYYMRQKPKD